VTPFAIAALQLHTSAVQDNFPRIRSRIDILMELYPWVQMVVLSELATLGPLQTAAQPLPCPAEDSYRELAARHRIWLLPGSFYEKKDGKIFNTAPVIDPEGKVIARYRKMFPFYPYEAGVEPGSEFVTFEVPDVGVFGVSICYDTWFPETTRTLAARGAEVILRMTLTSTIDREVELAIARATAAMNQCFVVDVNGLGDGGNGRSLFVGPAGDVLYEAGTAEEMIPLEINVERVRRNREIGLRGLGQPLKSFRDRRVEFDLYHPGNRRTPYLDTLGPLEKPKRGSRAGLRDAAPPPRAAAGAPPAARATGAAKGVVPSLVPGHPAAAPPNSDGEEES